LLALPEFGCCLQSGNLPDPAANPAAAAAALVLYARIDVTQVRELTRRAIFRSFGPGLLVVSTPAYFLTSLCFTPDVNFCWMLAAGGTQMIKDALASSGLPVRLGLDAVDAMLSELAPTTTHSSEDRSTALHNSLLQLLPSLRSACRVSSVRSGASIAQPALFFSQALRPSLRSSQLPTRST
jgi:hypothetical protein